MAEQQELPTIPWEPQVPRTECPTCHGPVAVEDGMLVADNTDATLTAELQRRGYVVYKKRPYMRKGRVRLANGTVLEQTTMEEQVAT